MSTLEGINGAVQLPEFLTVEQFAKLLQVSNRTGLAPLRKRPGKSRSRSRSAAGSAWRMGEDVKNWIDRGLPF